VVVVLLFGGPAAPQQRSVDELLQALEASSGEKSAGVLLPREKELWQMALELSERLRHKEKELAPEEIESLSARLAEMAKVEAAFIDRVTAFGGDVADHLAIRAKRYEFLLRALARTETDTAAAALIDVVKDGREPYAAVAMQELANLHDKVDVQAAAGPMIDALRSAKQPETLLVAATALSVIAEAGDRAAIDALSSLRLANEGEVSWSAALALARLGSEAGKSTFYDLLDRTFWQTGDRYEVQDLSGKMLRYPMPPDRVDAWLIASIKAASNLDDPQVWEMIAALERDPSPSVRGAALEAMKKREAVGA
jgi:HEAT repeat protein